MACVMGYNLSALRACRNHGRREGLVFPLIPNPESLVPASPSGRICEPLSCERREIQRYQLRDLAFRSVARTTGVVVRGLSVSSVHHPMRIGYRGSLCQ